MYAGPPQFIKLRLWRSKRTKLLVFKKQLSAIQPQIRALCKLRLPSQPLIIGDPPNTKSVHYSFLDSKSKARVNLNSHPNHITRTARHSKLQHPTSQHPHRNCIFFTAYTLPNAQLQFNAHLVQWHINAHQLQLLCTGHCQNQSLQSWPQKLTNSSSVYPQWATKIKESTHHLMHNHNSMCILFNPSMRSAGISTNPLLRRMINLGDKTYWITWRILNGLQRYRKSTHQCLDMILQQESLLNFLRDWTGDQLPAHVTQRWWNLTSNTSGWTLHHTLSHLTVPDLTSLDPSPCITSPQLISG
jgi:hypothetical protein